MRRNHSCASPIAVYVALGIIAALEINALVGKTGPMTSVKGVIHSSLGLTIAIWAVLQFL